MNKYEQMTDKIFENNIQTNIKGQTAYTVI